MYYNHHHHHHHLLVSPWGTMKDRKSCFSQRLYGTLWNYCLSCRHRHTLSVVMMCGGGRGVGWQGGKKFLHYKYLQTCQREGGKDGSRMTCRGNTTPVCAAGTCQSSAPCRRVGTRGRRPAVEMNLMSQSRANSLNSGFISRAWVANQISLLLEPVGNGWRPPIGCWVDKQWVEFNWERGVRRRTPLWHRPHRIPRWQRHCLADIIASCFNPAFHHLEGPWLVEPAG